MPPKSGSKRVPKESTVPDAIKLVSDLSESIMKDAVAKITKDSSVCTSSAERRMFEERYVKNTYHTPSIKAKHDTSESIPMKTYYRSKGFQIPIEEVP